MSSPMLNGKPIPPPLWDPDGRFDFRAFQIILICGYLGMLVWVTLFGRAGPTLVAYLLGVPILNLAIFAAIAFVFQFSVLAVAVGVRMGSRSSVSLAWTLIVGAAASLPPGLLFFSLVKSFTGEDESPLFTSFMVHNVVTIAAAWIVVRVVSARRWRVEAGAER